MKHKIALLCLIFAMISCSYASKKPVQINDLVTAIVALDKNEREQLSIITRNFLIQYEECRAVETEIVASEKIMMLAQELALFNYKSEQEIITLGNALADAQNRKDLMNIIWASINDKGIACNARVIMLFLSILINNPDFFTTTL